MATVEDVIGEGRRGRGPISTPRQLAIGLVTLMIAFSVAPIVTTYREGMKKDYPLWYHIGRIVLDGGEVYPTEPGRLFPFMYPPSCASMLAVGSLVGEKAFVIGLVLINSAAWLACILLSVYLVAGRPLTRDPWVYIVPSAAVIPFIHDTYLLGQPSLLLLALMLGAFACLRLKRDWSAGALIALAAGIKAFPIMAVGYLVYRRYWKATAATLVVLAGLLLVLPLPFRGPARTWTDLATWTRGMVLKYDEEGIAQRPDRCYSFKNQSILALGNRLLRSIPADGEADLNWKVNVADLDFKTVNRIIAAASLALCLFYIAMMPRAGRRTRLSDGIEFAMLTILMLFFAPLSFNYSYNWLIFPLSIVMALAMSAPAGSPERKAQLACAGLSIATLALAIPMLRGAQAYGNVFLSALVLFIWLGFELRRAGLRPEPSLSS
jgi:hypothetical protein